VLNQANPSEPYFPSISQNSNLYQNPTQTFAPVIERGSSQEDFDPTRVSELFCHYPEEVYISSTLPTRTLREHQEFISHCRLQHQAEGGREVIHHRRLSEARQITANPLNFKGLLWKHRTILTSSGILEEYSYICKKTSHNAADRAYLVPAFDVFYEWNNYSWTTTSANTRSYRV
jgi:hypothetical protein